MWLAWKISPFFFNTNITHNALIFAQDRLYRAFLSAIIWRMFVFPWLFSTTKIVNWEAAEFLGECLLRPQARQNTFFLATSVSCCGLCIRASWFYPASATMTRKTNKIGYKKLRNPYKKNNNKLCHRLKIRALTRNLLLTDRLNTNENELSTTNRAPRSFR